MADTTNTQQTASIKSIMAGGVWRSRRVVAALAITTGVAFGVAGTSIQQADASVGWCRSCTGNSVQATAENAKASKAVYTVRPSVYASTR